MNPPTRQMAKALMAWPGHMFQAADGARWRWDGEDWHPLQAGDTVLAPDGVTWFFWTERGLAPAELDVGAIVRVTWHRDGLDWHNQLCVVADVDPDTEHPTETQLLVGAWPDGDGAAAVVPAFVVELVAPAAP